MSATDDLLANAERYAATFDRGDLPGPPALGVAIVACMDARLDPAALFGLSEGDAHVIRNAGGVVTDEEIRSLAISQHLLGTTEIVLVHHTGCGMLTFTDEDLAARLEAETGARPAWSAHAFADLDTDVREAMARLRESPFLPSKQIRGFVYDVTTAALREVA